MISLRADYAPDGHEQGTPDGWKLPFAIFLYHAVYAVHLGAFYNPLPAASAASD